MLPEKFCPGQTSIAPADTVADAVKIDERLAKDGREGGGGKAWQARAMASVLM